MYIDGHYMRPHINIKNISSNLIIKINISNKIILII